MINDVDIESMSEKVRAIALGMGWSDEMLLGFTCDFIQGENKGVQKRFYEFLLHVARSENDIHNTVALTKSAGKIARDEDLESVRALIESMAIKHEDEVVEV